MTGFTSQSQTAGLFSLRRADSVRRFPLAVLCPAHSFFFYSHPMSPTLNYDLFYINSDEEVRPSFRDRCDLICVPGRMFGLGKKFRPVIEMRCQYGFGLGSTPPTQNVVQYAGTYYNFSVVSGAVEIGRKKLQTA
ncbi:hypothetical protein TNIN_255681 [Trichonephila inaurata madagascariensis]|uniref:Uncharacterized protein n=1 Tax=Trichonephila inaurata madagascariensis TaxID=2747483 RepID=A0A8X7C8Y8_9ARAC|nr:hypothetical protein TNIN_255681 [Trichonephila inaurata madagascariensis]